jgi:hypothetical protein
MAAESGGDVHHGALRCLLGLFDAVDGDLADWSEFDAEAERLSIEVRGLFPRDPYAKGDLPEPLPRLHGTAGTSICEDGKTGEVGFFGRSEGRKCSSRLSRSGAESGSTGRKRETKSIRFIGVFDARHRIRGCTRPCRMCTRSLVQYSPQPPRGI